MKWLVRESTVISKGINASGPSQEAHCMPLRICNPLMATRTPTAPVSVGMVSLFRRGNALCTLAHGFLY